MPKPGDGDRPSQADALRAREPGAGNANLLDRILDMPHAAQIVPRLSPEVLHRIVQSRGLEECARLMALATPEQMRRLFDLDLWRTNQRGLDERFDAERFGEWLEALVDTGAAAQTVARMDPALVVAALAHYVRVFDAAALSPAPAAVGCVIGGYFVAPKQTEAWDAIVDVLTDLFRDHLEYFHTVMRGCRRLSNAGFELDGLDNLLGDGEQALFDLGLDRERRREMSGYMTPAQARAFLQTSRRLSLAGDGPPPVSPIARAYFQALADSAGVDALHEAPTSSENAPPAEQPPADAVAAVVEVLFEAGLLAQQPRALLEAPTTGPIRLERIRAHMHAAYESDAAAYSMRCEELSYLTNTIAAGCSVQGRAFTPQEASDAAVSVCNLGLENWPSHWPLPDPGRHDAQDLIGVFQAGWKVLHDEVSMYVAGRLIGILKELRCGDREIQLGLRALRIELERHWRAGTPWHAGHALDVITSLDPPAWAALVALLGECPVMHAAVRASRGSRVLSISASDFEFISENSQIASIRAFLDSLPETLRA